MGRSNKPPSPASSRFDEDEYFDLFASEASSRSPSPVPQRPASPASATGPRVYISSDDEESSTPASNSAPSREVNMECSSRTPSPAPASRSHRKAAKALEKDMRQLGKPKLSENDTDDDDDEETETEAEAEDDGYNLPPPSTPRIPIRHFPRRNAIAGLPETFSSETIGRSGWDRAYPRARVADHDNQYAKCMGYPAMKINRKRKALNDGELRTAPKRALTTQTLKIHPHLNRGVLEKMMEFLPKSLPLGAWDTIAHAMTVSSHGGFNEARNRNPGAAAMSAPVFDGRQLQSFWHGALTDWVKQISDQ